MYILSKKPAVRWYVNSKALPIALTTHCHKLISLFSCEITQVVMHLLSHRRLKEKSTVKT